MPRLCPTQTISHRLELGTYERRLMRDFQRSYRFDKVLENVPQMVGLSVLGGGIYYGMKYGGAAIGAGLDLAKDAGQFMKDMYEDLDNSIRNVDSEGNAKTVSTTNLKGEETEINVPFSGSSIGWLSRGFVEAAVWLPNPFTGEIPGTAAWAYRKYKEGQN